MTETIWTFWNKDHNNIYIDTKKLVEKSTKNNIEFIKMNISNEQSYRDAVDLLNNDICECVSMRSICDFLQYVHPLESVKKMCNKSESLLRSYIVALNFNEDIYNKIKDLHKYGKKHKYMNQTDEKFLDKLITKYIRNGINLTQTNRYQLIKIKNEIIKTEKHISNNMELSDNITYCFTQSELEGMPDNILNKISQKKDNNGYHISLNKYSYIPCMSYIKNDITRKKIELLYHTKCANIATELIKLFVLKDEYAKLLSYKNYAEYQTKIQMAKSSENIVKFLFEISNKVTNKTTKELDTLKKIKKAKKSVCTDIASHDIQYYVTKWKKQYGIGDKMIREYFPLNIVTGKIFTLYEQLFDVKFIKIKSEYKWAENIYNYVAVNEQNQVLGYFYIDLIKRHNKCNQIRCFSLQQRSTVSYPISVLVGNFEKESSLLSHNDVILLFHEFSHIVHQMLDKSNYCLLNCNNMEDDYNEIPAKILENLCWNNKIIKFLSCHYVTHDQMNNDMIDKIIKIRDINVGIHYKKHIMLSLYDQLIHSSTTFLNSARNILKNIYPKNNTDGNKAAICLLSNLYEKIFRNTFTGENEIAFNKGSIMPASWFNFMGDTDARYYGYLWSKIVSSDIYSEKFTDFDLINNKSDGMIMFRKIMLENEQLLSGQMLISKYISIDPYNNNKNNNPTTDVDQSYYMSTDKFKTAENKYTDTENNYEDLSYSNRFTEIYSDDYVTENDSNAEAMQHIISKLNILDNK